MSRAGLPIETLPAWALLNDVAFVDIKVVNTEEKGYGVVCEKNLSTKQDTSDSPTLLTAPHSLVLNAEAVQEYAKEDKSFRQLLNAVGHHSARRDILLFLLVQMVLASRPSQPPVGVSNPWTEYLKFLTKEALVPTLWTEEERLLLRGTSLNTAVNAKISALDVEFDAVREPSSDIPCWNDMFWTSGAISFRDWILLDALYRSRCLELPRSGESLVPCIDMINHSSNPTAYYDENSKDEAVLLLRPGIDIAEGDEVTISYGDTKSAAEMLFSYGFIDPTSTAESLALPLDAFPDDPLARAKLVLFGEAPKVHVARDHGSITWRSPFAYLMCVNEEDGLEFRVLQDTEGARQLRVFWQDEDVTDQKADFETLIRAHPLAAILRLRVVTVVQECLQAQLDKLRGSALDSTIAATNPSLLREDCAKAALLLRQVEASILETGVEALEKEASHNSHIIRLLLQRCSLLADEDVVAYLGSMETAELDIANEEASNEAEDFS
ncbi:hypothetical protein B0T17DRAFT_496679 [Bombardia bombarda]|uniref:SET domain-containing protein n=1 Tax=Bombardia bombarda TaxID=252184 RepID=A0AA40BW89_9PEZI|nr:hypothetical protein B0T17DRAFT_496679 [Bombardia bombarda]